MSTIYNKMTQLQKKTIYTPVVYIIYIRCCCCVNIIGAAKRLAAVFFSFVILLYNIFRVVAAAGHECLSGFIHLFIIASASVFYLHIGSLAHV